MQHRQTTRPAAWTTDDVKESASWCVQMVWHREPSVRAQCLRGVSAVVRPGERVSLDRGSTTFGKGNLDSTAFSRNGPSFEHSEEGLTLIPKSGGQCRVDGQPAPGGAALVDQDVVSIGDAHFVVRRGAGAAVLARSHQGEGWHPIVGFGEATHQLISRLPLLSTAKQVLLLGPTGTGKGQLARCLASLRSDDTFVARNLRGIPVELVGDELFGHAPGAFHGATRPRGGAIHAARDGTLFLDEVGDLVEGVQVTLLDLLDSPRRFKRLGSDQEVLARCLIIAATDRDTTDLRVMRLPLKQRFGLDVVHLPALVERRQDIPVLIHSLCGDHLDSRVGRSAMCDLLTFPWPGNLRELAAVCDGLRRNTSLTVRDALKLNEHAPTTPSRINPGATRAERLLDAIARSAHLPQDRALAAISEEMNRSPKTMYRWCKDDLGESWPTLYARYSSS